ncbi:MAG: polysaccharide deacetylase family protein [Candidatus Riflebacteria bacterium]|nr:polysaccharide deacetylase family protein [Candidatus Riflebacteria bacterium]
MKNTITALFLMLALFNLPLCARDDIAAFCYHQVEPVASGRFSLSLERFKSQLKYLKDRNYRSLNSDELLEAIAPDAVIGGNKVVITFDDGFRTVYDYAFPAMQEFGFKGIVCIYPAFIGSSKAMTWEQLDQLIKEGWSVECHSMSHSNLVSKYGNPIEEKSFLEHEILTSRKIIETRLGNRVKFMVWPYGVYSDRSIKLAEENGFLGAMTVDGGANYRGMSPWLIKRQVIYSTDDMNKFLIRFGMAALPLSEQYPAPGQVINQLATFS